MEQISVSEPWFSYICNGKKRIEAEQQYGILAIYIKKVD